MKTNAVDNAIRKTAKKHAPLSDIEAEQRGIKVDRHGLVRCRVCGCTETQPCEPPCAWVEVDLCNGCAEVVKALVEWEDGAHRANRTALLRELDAKTYKASATQHFREREVRRNTRLFKASGGAR